MKRILLTIFSLFITSLLFAQKQSILDSTNVWQYKVSSGAGEFAMWHHYERIYYGRDTIINTDTCRTLYRQSNNYREDLTSGGITAFWGTTYDTMGYVFVDASREKISLINRNGSRTELYDFSRQVGDSLFLSDCRFRVINIDTVMINSAQHRVWEYDNYDTAAARPGHNHFIIEGIGSTLNFFEPFYCYRPLSYGGIGDLHCFTSNGNNPVLDKTIDGFDNASSCLLSVGDTKPVNQLQVRVVPNPATDNSVVEFPVHISGHIAIYDITGRLITQDQFIHTGSYSLRGKIPCSGLYTYRLVTADGQATAGRFIYQ